MTTSCERCGERLGIPARGRSPRFCSPRCRAAAYRARKPRLPARMTGERRWVRADGKRPVMADGRPASSTDESTWSTYADVLSGAGDGFGVMLGDGLACWDLDGCFDGEQLTPWAATVLDEVEAPLFVEKSVSGRGLHVFVEAPEGPGRSRGGVEFYSRGRFIRVTGDKFGRW